LEVDLLYDFPYFVKRIFHQNNDKGMLKFWIMSMLLCSTLAVFGQETGLASFYADKFHGSSTASGEPYDKDLNTAAHKTHPFGTILRVTRLDNGQSVIVKVNDRGPFYRNRVVDLSKKAAKKIGLIQAGTAMVKVEIVSKPNELSKKLSKTKKPVSKSSIVNVNDPKKSSYGMFKVTSERVTKGYGVQIGVYSDYKNVLKQVAILNKNRVFNVVVSIEKNSKGKDIYKILAGPYGKLEDASASKSALRKKGFTQCFVTNLEKKKEAKKEEPKKKK
jgi:rare lipoprotein A